MDPTRRAGSPSRSLFSRVLHKRGTQTDAGPTAPSTKGPLGLNTLHMGSPGQLATAHVIFVHGLNGGSQSTWTKGGDPTLFWPREWLPSEAGFQDVGIHSFGYPAAIASESILTLHDFSRSLLAAVKDSPSIGRSEEKSPIVFVAHSMGGLVAKKAYVIASQDAEFQPLADRIRSIIFLATPHQGSSLAQTLSRLVSFASGARPFLEDLVPQSVALQAINEEFPRVCDRLQLMSFFETKPMSGLGMIVDKASAVTNLPNERRTLLDADHRHVAMFASPADPSCIAVRDALATVVQSFRSATITSNPTNKLHADLAIIKRFLGVAHDPQDDLVSHDSARLEGSCQWLHQKDYFISWRQAGASRMLWLQGRPGVGKSVLASEVISSLQIEAMHCCYFFFHEAESNKQTPGDLLRFLAWQLATTCPDALACLAEVASNAGDKPLERNNAGYIWRKLFLSALLRITLKTHLFLVIDAMDECSRGSELVAFLAHMQHQWPTSVLVTSRDAPIIHLSGITRPIELITEIIREEDNSQDIGLLLESKISFLPFQSSSRWPTRREMIAEISAMSGGSFLWASLISSELLEACTESEVVQVLEGVPSDMDSLYTKVLDKMSRMRFGRRLAKSILTWTTYSLRALTIPEMKDPVEMDIGDKVEDMEMAIRKCCGQLVYVDVRKRVQLVHLTAREFLVRLSTDSYFAVTPQEAHKRLGILCLRHLSRLGIPSPTLQDSGLSAGPTTNESPKPPFVEYASLFAFEHLRSTNTADPEVFVELERFLRSHGVLRWIEFIAGTGELQPVNRAGDAINHLLRLANHQDRADPEPNQQAQYELIGKWGEDLLHITAKFSTQLRQAPLSIHHVLPAICPKDSAIWQQFGSLRREVEVQRTRGEQWDDCFTTITYGGNAAACGAVTDGFLAIALHASAVVIYDDRTMQEVRRLTHRTEVESLAFSSDGRFLAAADRSRVRVWDTNQWEQQAGFSTHAECLAMAFCADNSVLLVATKDCRLHEWRVGSRRLSPERKATSSRPLPGGDSTHPPKMVAISPSTSLVAIGHEGEDPILWDPNGGLVRGVFKHPTRQEPSKGFFAYSGIFGGPTESEFAAIYYSDSSLVVYRSLTCIATASLPRAYTKILASSADGKTLARSDYVGNITVVDFETLKPLHSLELEHSPRNLCFSSSGLRLIIVGYECCRVWQPAALRCRDQKGPQELSNEATSPTTTLECPKKDDKATATITCIACSTEQPLIFCGMNDGSIHIYATEGTLQGRQLFKQSRRHSITHLALAEAPLTIACSDRGGRVTVREVRRQDTGVADNSATRARETLWIAAEPVVKILVRRPRKRDRRLMRRFRSYSKLRIKQILISGKHHRLLISGEYHRLREQLETYYALFSTRKADSGRRCISGSTTFSDWPGPVYEDKERWAAHPVSPDLLIRSSARPSQLDFYKWETFEKVRTVCLPQSSLDILPLAHPRFFLVRSRILGEVLESFYIFEPRQQAQLHRVMRVSDPTLDLWDLSRFDHHDRIPALTRINMRQSGIEGVLGSFASRLVVYTTDHWVASLDLDHDGPGDMASSLVKHFIVPSDWHHSLSHNRILGIGQRGEIIYTVGPGLVVVKRGLEIVGATGERFDPLRSGTQGLHGTATSGVVGQG